MQTTNPVIPRQSWRLPLDDEPEVKREPVLHYHSLALAIGFAWGLSLGVFWRELWEVLT